MNKTHMPSRPELRSLPPLLPPLPVLGAGDPVLRQAVRGGQEMRQVAEDTRRVPFGVFLLGCGPLSGDVTAHLLSFGDVGVYVCVLLTGGEAPFLGWSAASCVGWSSHGGEVVLLW